MNDVIIFSIISLGGIGLAAAIILYFVAQKFKVIEDPKIDEVEEALPAANCGGCGYPGCRSFAEASVKKANKDKNIEGLFCPVGGNEVMSKVASILGLEAKEQEPMVAVLRCSGSRKMLLKKLTTTDLKHAHSLIIFIRVKVLVRMVALDLAIVLMLVISMQCIWMKKQVFR